MQTVIGAFRLKQVQLGIVAFRLQRHADNLPSGQQPTAPHLSVGAVAVTPLPLPVASRKKTLVVHSSGNDYYLIALLSGAFNLIGRIPDSSSGTGRCHHAAYA